MKRSINENKKQQRAIDADKGNFNDLRWRKCKENQSVRW